MTPPSKCLSVVVKRPGMMIGRSVDTILPNAYSSRRGQSLVLLSICLVSTLKVVWQCTIRYSCADLLESRSIFVSLPLDRFFYEQTKEIDERCRGIKAEK